MSLAGLSGDRLPAAAALLLSVAFNRLVAVAVVLGLYLLTQARAGERAGLMGLLCLVLEGLLGCWGLPMVSGARAGCWLCCCAAGGSSGSSVVLLLRYTPGTSCLPAGSQVRQSGEAVR